MNLLQRQIKHLQTKCASQVKHYIDRPIYIVRNNLDGKKTLLTLSPRPGDHIEYVLSAQIVKEVLIDPETKVEVISIYTCYKEVRKTIEGRLTAE